MFDKFFIQLRLKLIADKLNKGQSVFKSGQTRYNLGYSVEDDSLTSVSSSGSVLHQGTIYCVDPDFVDVAIEQIGYKNLVEYIKGVQNG